MDEATIPATFAIDATFLKSSCGTTKKHRYWNPINE
jgi:hypothetical protein